MSIFEDVAMITNAQKVGGYGKSKRDQGTVELIEQIKSVLCEQIYLVKILSEKERAKKWLIIHF